MAEVIVAGRTGTRVSLRENAAFRPREAPLGIERSSAPSRTLPELVLSLHADLDAIEAEWRRFETEAACTAFQAYDWIVRWQRHIGARSGTRPAIVIGRDPGGRTLFIFPLAVERRWYGRRLTWLASDLCDYNAPLLAPDLVTRLDGESFPALWHEIVALVDSHPSLRFDLIDVSKMPARIGGAANPFMALSPMPASSGAHLANLGQDWDAFFASKRSGATRKRERRQFQNLAKYGEVRFAEPTETAEIERTLAVLFEQKAASFARLGIENFLTRPGHREFFADLATSGAGGLSHVSRLDVGETWAATNFGLEFRGRYYLLISSYEHGELSRFGLGRAHIQALMRRAIEHGLREFDFTIGDEAYKLDWSDTKIALYGHFAAMRLRGMPAVLGFAAFRHAKRTIKQNPVLWRLYRQARERLRRVRSM